MSAAAEVLEKKRGRQRRRPKEHPFLPRNVQTPQFLKWLRRTHGWLGLWGAVAGLLFGISTILLVHAEVFPTGTGAESVVQLPVNGAIISNPNQLGAYVQTELGLDTDWRAGPRAPRRAPDPDAPATAPRGMEGGSTEARSAPGAAGERAGERAASGMADAAGGARGGADAAPTRVTNPVHQTRFLSPSRTLDVRYIEGNEYIEITRTGFGFLETVKRLHSGRTAQLGWLLLGDAFSGALVVLAVTGVLLWSRMDGSRLLAIGLGGTGFLTVLYFALVGA